MSGAPEPAASRYRRYAGLRSRLLTAAMRRIPLVSVAQQARALSLWDGKQVAPGDEMQLAMVFDLGVLDPLGEHTRGIDRQAKAEPPPPGSEEERMLTALARAEFGLHRLLGPDPEGGVLAERLPDGARLRIWDSFLGTQAPGRLAGLRIAWPEEDLAMTCGVVTPVDAPVLRALLLGAPPERGPVQPRHPAPEDEAGGAAAPRGAAAAAGHRRPDLSRGHRRRAGGTGTGAHVLTDPMTGGLWRGGLNRVGCATR